MKLGIIGSGMIVQDFLTTADQIDNLELTAISSTKRSAGIAQELAQKYNISQTYTDNEKSLPNINAYGWSWWKINVKQQRWYGLYRRA